MILEIVEEYIFLRLSKTTINRNASTKKPSNKKVTTKTAANQAASKKKSVDKNTTRKTATTSTAKGA
jgi:hypothetical protein